MGKLVITEFVTLDGVMEDPGGAEGFEHGGWAFKLERGPEGDKFKYKPGVCSLFPIQQDERDRWYVRQKGYKGEKWDLFCLDPAQQSKRAAESLGDELALAESFQQAAEASARAQASVAPPTIPGDSPTSTG